MSEMRLVKVWKGRPSKNKSKSKGNNLRRCSPAILTLPQVSKKLQDNRDEIIRSQVRPCCNSMRIMMKWLQNLIAPRMKHQFHLVLMSHLMEVRVHNMKHKVKKVTVSQKIKSDKG